MTFMICTFWSNWRFAHLMAITIRPYYSIKGRMMICVVVLPSLNWGFCYRYWCILFCCRGDHRRGEINYNSRSPLSEPECIDRTLVVIQMSGRLHRSESVFSTLILPSLNRICSAVIQVFIYSCRGDSQGRKFNSRSPFYEPILSLFNGINFNPILRVFLISQFCHDPRLHVVYHSSPRAHTMYIYSLGHFLTTKGALIDGDWGGSKNDQFWPKATKKEWKNHWNWSKIVVKNEWKKWLF